LNIFFNLLQAVRASPIDHYNSESIFTWLIKTRNLYFPISYPISNHDFMSEIARRVQNSKECRELRL